MDDLGQVPCVNSGAPRIACLQQPADIRAAQAGYPAAARLLPQAVDLRARQHAAVTHEDEPRYAEAPAQPVDLVPHRDRPAAGIGHQPVDDAGQPGAVAVGTALRQGAFAGVVGAARHVIQDCCPRGKVPPGQLALDEGLAGREPVHRRIQVVLVHVLHAELLRERGVPEQGDRLQLRARLYYALGYHRQHDVALRAGLGRHQIPHAEPAHCRADGPDVAAWQGSLDLEKAVGLHKMFALERGAQRRHRLGRQHRQVGKRALDGAPALAAALAQQDCGRGFAVRHDVNVHGLNLADLSVSCKRKNGVSSKKLLTITWAQMERILLP